jgi:hypothetical protein
LPPWFSGLVESESPNPSSRAEFVKDLKNTKHIRNTTRRRAIWRKGFERELIGQQFIE